ncbi:MAG TPA: hypothetical protein VG733_02850 [Chthoniobacteraceae bacterium]|nr:hypothetical protein [Chthoniobacteraceae bacterium]
MRHILNICAASLFFILNLSCYAQNKNAPAPVAAPSPSGAGPTTATIDGAVDVHQATIANVATDVMQLGSDKQPGVHFFTGAVQAPAEFPGGKLFWLETCVPDRWRQDNNGKWTHLASDSPCVNRNAPSSIGKNGEAIESPMVILDPNYQVQTVYDQYTTYLMFQSDMAGSIPVPIASFSWYWTGVGTRNGAKWNLTNAGTSGNPRPDAHPALPTWSAALDALSYK